MGPLNNSGTFLRYRASEDVVHSEPIPITSTGDTVELDSYGNERHKTSPNPPLHGHLDIVASFTEKSESSEDSEEIWTEKDEQLRQQAIRQDLVGKEELQDFVDDEEGEAPNHEALARFIAEKNNRPPLHPDVEKIMKQMFVDTTDMKKVE